LERLTDFYNGKEILLLGGTGSLGKALLRKFKARFPGIKGVRIFSRDEYKQWHLRRELETEGIADKVSFLIGDVRNGARLKRAFAGVDIVINCAAMKHVGACEMNPLEAVQTNVDGAANIIAAALDCQVRNVLHVSTDKAVYPVNLYGATKAVAEKLFIDASVYRGGNYRTQFACVRYGNVFGSRGSLVEMIRNANGESTPITDKRMTRFFITLDMVTDFIISRIADMESGRIYVPNMKAIKITELVDILAPGNPTHEIGIQKGEKLHECLVSTEEMRAVELHGDFMAITQSDMTNIVVDPLTSEIAEKHNRLDKETIERWL
jgi:UDP-N-acetylglucosamine 4,6-dehydratase